MERTVFDDRLRKAARMALEFVREHLRQVLPAEVLFNVFPNQSYDENPRVGDEVVFPAESLPIGAFHGPWSHDEVVQFLWRAGKVPEWIDVAVEDADVVRTLIGLKCCGRFTGQDELLYHHRSGIPPFAIKSPELPIGWESVEVSGKFDLRWREQLNRPVNRLKQYGPMRLIPLLYDAQHRHGHLSEAALRDLSRTANVPLHRLQQLVSFYPHFRTTPPPRVELAICRDMSCYLAAGEVCAKKLKELTSSDVEVHEVSCLGRCEQAPAAAINGVPVAAANVDRIKDWFLHPETIPNPRPNPPRSWTCDPHSTPNERYSTISRLRLSGEAAIKTLVNSGLRGMGGAGFPTGVKWDLVRKETRTPKYVICNADESEPGTFKDREILADLPHLVIEGMILAGLVVGAKKGILYIRHEYGPERERVEAELKRAYDLGVLGNGFGIEVFVSPGGYILGEETALLEALEDKRGEPRNKPPFPGTHGLFGLPTLINNVETLAMATAILNRGADWWKAQGRPGFTGLKFISVSGHVEKPGVYEIATGTTVRELIDMAGGVKDGRPLFAFAPGGASSNFLPAALADVPLDFNAIAKVGSMLGSGALVVVAEGTDMLALATNVVRFFRNESCGKCVPCRVGSQKAVELLEGVLAGTMPRTALQVLPELGETLTLTSICGLGQVAVNPALSVLKQWPELGK